VVAIDLCSSWSCCERRSARDLLAPVYDLFTEGFDTSDLLDELEYRGQHHVRLFGP